MARTKMRRYKVGVGACGPTVLYDTIKAMDAEDACKQRYGKQWDTFSEEKKADLIHYMELSEVAPAHSKKAEEINVRDIRKIKLNANDNVAIVCKNDSQKWVIRKAEYLGNHGYRTIFRVGEKEVFVMMKDDGILSKALKIDTELPSSMDDGAKDALGRALAVGDLVAYRAPLELSNCKGFEGYGIVESVTAKMVTVNDKENNQIVRKRLDNIVVIKKAEL